MSLSKFSFIFSVIFSYWFAVKDENTELDLFFIGFFSSRVLSSLLNSARESSISKRFSRQAAKPLSCFAF